MLCEMIGKVRIERYIMMVLILVLMEYALRGVFATLSPTKVLRLNPCFNGICSARYESDLINQIPGGLNPCFNGICSASNFKLIICHK